ncbi:MAG: 2-oxo acid dehydrogenase subunit E2, partial [Burkholderiales bacterium]
PRAEREAAPVGVPDTGRRPGTGPAAAGVAVKAAPAVRRLARERGVDLACLRPTGPGGTISREDVLEAARGEPLHGVRRAMAERMQAAHAEVAVATVTARADVDAWAAAGDVMPRMVRAVATACRSVPALNAWYHGDTMRRELHQRVHLGIAVDTEEGLFVPVLRDAGALAPESIAAELEPLVASVRNRTIAPERLRGATVTLSNFGAIGGVFAAMVVVPPQVAIVGAGRAAREVVAGDSGPVVRMMLPLSLSFDHRAVTGGEAASFLGALIEDLERVD